MSLKSVLEEPNEPFKCWKMILSENNRTDRPQKYERRQKMRSHHMGTELPWALFLSVIFEKRSTASHYWLNMCVCLLNIVIGIIPVWPRHTLNPGYRVGIPRQTYPQTAWAKERERVDERERSAALVWICAEFRLDAKYLPPPQLKLSKQWSFYQEPFWSQKLGELRQDWILSKRKSSALTSARKLNADLSTTFIAVFWKNAARFSGRVSVVL